jgi:hypothetical protein
VRSSDNCARKPCYHWSWQKQPPLVSAISSHLSALWKPYGCHSCVHCKGPAGAVIEVCVC